MKLAYFIIALVVSSLAKAQNLVPNSSFEQKFDCPPNVGLISYCISWFDLLENSTDYYNSCSNTFMPRVTNPGVPKNALGFQNAISGESYAGFVSYQHVIPNYFEYISVQLKRPLVSNKSYVTSLYVSLAGSSQYAIDTLGVHFSYDSLKNNCFPKFNHSLYCYEPQIKSSIGFIRDTINWILVKDTFQAAGGENFITVGNFKRDNETNFQQFYSTVNGLQAYYYIDDVSVIKVPDDFDLSIEKVELFKQCFNGQDSIELSLQNFGKNALDFSSQALNLSAELYKNGTLQKSINQSISNNLLNPQGQPLANLGVLKLKIGDFDLSDLNAQYELRLNASLAVDEDVSNNVWDTIFTSAHPLGLSSVNASQLCAGSRVQLYASNFKASSFWQLSYDNINWQNIGPADTLSHFPERTAWYRVATCDRVFSQTYQVNVLVPPVISESIQFCEPGEYSFSVPSENPQVNWYWFAQNNNSDTLNVGTTFQDSFANSTQYVLRSQLDSCLATQESKLAIEIGGCPLKLPNVFTPNGDGINDLFEVETFTEESLEVFIYNRWGALLKQWQGIGSWDGEGAKAGVYFYVIRLGEEEYKGQISLIR